MGLPKFILEFKKRADTVTSRSMRGIVAVIIVDGTKTDTDFFSYSYSDKDDIVKSHWTSTNLDYLEMIFKGKTEKVIVERIATTDDYTDALARLQNRNWDWLTFPGLTAENVKPIADWIIRQRSEGKTFKAVLPCASASIEPNCAGIVNFATDEIKTTSKEYTDYEYCARIAGLLAGIPLNESAVYEQLSEIVSIKESTTANSDIDAGQLIIINDGEKFKLARPVTSLTAPSETETDDLKKIKIVEARDFIFDDIKNVFENTYIGIANSYDNKQLFIAEINTYLDRLQEQGVLADDGDNYVEIDVAAQKAWLKNLGKNVDNMTDEQIKTAKTGSYIFISGILSFLDAIEDMKFTMYM